MQSVRRRHPAAGRVGPASAMLIRAQDAKTGILVYRRRRESFQGKPKTELKNPWCVTLSGFGRNRGHDALSSKMAASDHPHSFIA